MNETRFSIRTEWQSADGVTAPELAATWCLLRIDIGGRTVTLVEDERTGSLRHGIHTSAYVLAEWVAEHWWLLRADLRPSALPHTQWRWSRVDRQPWLRNHNLRGAGGGLPWPDLTIVPEGDVTALSWAPVTTPARQPVRFLAAGSDHVRTDAVSRTLASFVDEVLQRLEAHGIAGTPLQREWQLVVDADADENAFAAAAARTGRDPFDLPDEDADFIVQMSTELDDDVLAEFLDAADPDALTEAWRWMEMAQKLFEPATSAMADSQRARERVIAPAADRPWEAGYAAARQARRDLKLTDREIIDADELVVSHTVAEPSGGLLGLVSAEADVVSLVLPETSATSTTSRRFFQARALGLTMLSSRTLFCMTPTVTALAAASRAFAAELLAPSDGIAEYLDVLPTVNDDAFEAIAARFGVSSLVVQHQYENQISH